MATVFLARDLRHDRNVALKLLHAELGAVLGPERFLSEIRVTAKLNHPNLLPLFDSGEANGLLFYVMPFVEGGSLRARLDRERQLPVDDAVHIAAGIAAALDSAHRVGIIHRDLKPENILMHEGQPLVADFGIALAISNAGGERVTRTGLSLGTPQYMSPEQATGDRAIDGRTDVYSLGAMTYEMLTGEPPHTGSTAQIIMARLLAEEPRAVRAVRPSVPEHIEVAVHRALEKLPADRWPTAGSFADALQDENIRPVSGNTTARRRAGRQPTGWRARVRDPLSMGLGAAAILGLSLAGVLWMQRHAVRAEPVISFPLNVSRNAAAWTALRGTIAISSDGATIAFVGTGALGLPVLFVRPLGELTPRALPGTEGAEQPFFSPDGRWLGFWSDGKLQKVPVEGGAPTTLAVTPLMNGAAWSTKGLVVFTRDRGLAVVHDDGGAVEQLTTPDPSRGEYSQSFPVVLADGETVLYASQRDVDYRSARIATASLSRRATQILDLAGISPLGMFAGRLVYASAGHALLAAPFDVRARAVLGAPTQVLSDVSVASA
ncbi:MAG TPA: protein kinase, partial [Usitatibacter sp.]